MKTPPAKSLVELDGFPSDPADFYRACVAPRIPCLVHSHPAGIDAPSLTNKVLARASGDAVVNVEVRGEESKHFGHGVRRALKFSDLLAATDGEAGRSLYMTTQDIDPDREEPNHLSRPFTDPVEGFVRARLVPARPVEMGSLIPYTVNCWLGGGKRLPGDRPTSTGLHVDYHDNLYVLLRGRKRFTLYGPWDARRMATVGKVAQVHANGLINFEEIGKTREDGAVESDVRRWRFRKAEAAATEAREALQRAMEEKRPDKELRSLQAKLDEAESLVEDLLEGELGGGGDGEDGGDSDDFELVDDFDESCGESDDHSDNHNNNNNDRNAKPGGKPSASASQPKHTGNEAETPVGDFPVNFSRVDRRVMSETEIRAKFPDFPSRPVAVVDVRAGESLYLPAGYFHAVESSVDDGGKIDAGNDNDNNNGEGGLGGHAALNYWYYPPNVGCSHAEPYADAFWSDRWSAVVRDMNALGVDPDFAGEAGVARDVGDERREKRQREEGNGGGDAKGVGKKKKSKGKKK